MSGGLALVLTGYALGIAWLLWRIETTPPVCQHDDDCDCPTPNPHKETRP